MGGVVSVLINKFCVCPAEMERFGKAPELPSFRWKFLFPLLNQSLPKKVEPRWLIWCWGDWRNPALFGAAFLTHPPVWLGSVGLALQDATSVRESLVPTFAYLYSGAVPSPPLVCLCSINLQNRARLVISPWSLFLLISLQNRSTWTLLFQSLMCSPCQAVVQAARFALNGTRKWNLVFICWLHCQERKYHLKRQQENANVEL